ncbi:hypothetical protein BK133_23240 [Paenibacillus sp. FSL H8-0548]|uniref:DUF4183 domain-containing protein n=1 Tax=Paenibacillus sp. FSL H8-0548 TaxID=1920422 RepID=UPI00096E757F|nr:DUF4183 domain-containing protein [Paenibacillus sp. FSL H8-0548]OMF24135.1 hypothetical protein BK133_23240 [Paenibacillus sp. FSL H8-0548]
MKTRPIKKLKAAARLNCRSSKIVHKKVCKRKACCACSLKRKKKHKKIIADKKILTPSAQRGEQGISGAPGAQGVQGPQGAQGASGAPGVQGPQGASGPDSISELIILPTAQRYFYSMNADTVSPVRIPASEFSDDEGAFITAFPSVRPNSYSNLYINGVLQEGSLYHLNESDLSINTNKQTIFSGTPIILENVSFTLKIIS